MRPAPPARPRPARHPNLGGLTALDGASVANQADSALQHSTAAAGETGGKAVQSAVPATGKTTGSAVKKVTPVAQKAAGEAAGSAGGLLGDTTKTATQGGLPTDSLTKSAPSLPVGGGLPLGG